MNNFAFYCSGNASRVTKFYDSDEIRNNFRCSFIYYDNSSNVVIDKLKSVKPIGCELIIPDDMTSKLPRNEFSKYISNELNYYMNKMEVNYLFCFGDKILKDPLISNYYMKIVNFHPSLLPAFPGLNAIDQALKTSVQILGNTAHFIDYRMDSGPIILQSVISRSRYSSYEDVLDLQIPMLKKIWSWLEKDMIIFNQNFISIKGEQNINNIYFSA